MPLRLRTVNPRDLLIPETRVTSHFDDEHLAMFRQSVKDLGIMEPPYVIETPDGLMVVDGAHRVVEAINNGEQKIRIMVDDGQAVDVVVKNLAVSNLRGKTIPSQLIAPLASLYEEYGMGTDDIAEKTGFSRAYIERLLIISRAAPEVLQELDEGKIGLGHAEVLARIDDVPMQLRLLSQAVAYRMTIAQLKDLVAETQAIVEERVQAPPPEPPPAPATFPCHYCAGMFPANQIQNPNTCIHCFGILAGAISVARAEAQAEAQGLQEVPAQGEAPSPE